MLDKFFVGYTCRQLNQRGDEHLNKEHLSKEHYVRRPNLLKTFLILQKCHENLHCRVCENAPLRNKTPEWNTQADPIRPKLNILLKTVSYSHFHTVSFAYINSKTEL